MLWRTAQLGEQNCEQDNIILKLYKDVPVKYIGADAVFARKLKLDNSSNHVIAVFNQYAWLSEFIEFVKLLNSSQSFYLGVNRYMLLGNDTNIRFDFDTPSGKLIIDLVDKLLPAFNIVQSGFRDDDQGRYFNFVQPLTWIYATNKNN